MYRNPYSHSDPEIMRHIHISMISMIRPHLEYASAVWHPRQLKDIRILGILFDYLLSNLDFRL